MQGYVELMFTPHVKDIQEERGARTFHAGSEQPDAPVKEALGQEEKEFIASRDSFYMASVTETGWPYIQHQGGPVGFLKTLDEFTLGFADYSGAMRRVSIGNLASNDRVVLFLMDYLQQRRLKLFGRARLVDIYDDAGLMERLRERCPAMVELGVVISVEGFNWNCNQRITPRFNEAELAEALAPVRKQLQEQDKEIGRLHTELGRLKGQACI